jgi:GntR family transcriptional regulator
MLAFTLLGSTCRARRACPAKECRTVTAGRFFVRPLYRQLRDALADRIATGEWRAGQALPSEQDLAREFEVSAGTLRKGLNLLERDRLIFRRRGKGTFVNNPSGPAELARFTNLRASNGDRVLGQLSSVEIEHRAPSESEKTLLRLAPDAHVCALRRLRLHRGAPLLIEDVLLSNALFSDVTDAEWRSCWLTDIAPRHGVLLGNATEKLTPAGASAGAAQTLKIPQGSIVFVLERLITTLDGRPAQWRRAECVSRDVRYQAISG